MTGKDRDPLESLGRHEDPEPDPERMRKTIAASRAAFARSAAERAAEERPRRRQRSSGMRGRSWRYPAAVGLAAAAVVILIALSVFRSGLQPDDAGPAARLAEAPADAAREGVRLGARPHLSRQPVEMDVPAGMHRVDGSELSLAYRVGGGRLELHILTPEGTRQIDSWPVASGAEAAVTAAFQAARSDSHPEILVVKVTHGPAGSRAWHAYVHEGGEIRRDAAISALLSDAVDRREAERRLRNVE